MEWAINREDADLALQISSQSATFWWIRGHATEGRRWLHGALAIRGEASPAVRIRALEEAAHLAFRQGDNGEARQLADESIRLAQEHGDTGRLARTLRLLTLVAAGEGDFDHSRALALESAEAARASGDHWALVMALNNLGLAALESHQPSQARSLLEEAASLANANGDERSRAFVLENLAFARLMDGDRLGARTDFVESLVLANELEFAEVIAMDLTGLAAVEAAGQRFVLAARVLGRADRLLEETGTYQDAIESQVRAQTLRALEAALGVDALAYELQAGRAFSLDEVVALALASID